MNKVGSIKLVTQFIFGTDIFARKDPGIALHTALMNLGVMHHERSPHPGLYRSPCSRTTIVSSRL